MQEKQVIAVPKSWHRTGRFIANLDLYFATILLAFLIGLTFMGVIMRYFVSEPIVWLEEIQLAVFLWITFLGGSAAFRTGSQVAIEILVDRLPRKIRMVIEILIAVIVIVILGYLMINGLSYISLLISASRKTAILKIPYSLIYGIPIWSCVLMAINQAYEIATRYGLKKNAVNDSGKGEAQ